MTTPHPITDAVGIAATALRWSWRNDLDMARNYLDKLTTVERAEARMNLLRLAALIQAKEPEAVAAAVLTPDSVLLPEVAHERYVDALERRQA